MLMNIIFAVLIGGLVGVAGHIRNEGKLVMPRKTKKVIFLSIIAGFGGDVLC